MENNAKVFSHQQVAPLLVPALLLCLLPLSTQALGPATNYAVQSMPSSIAIADLNADTFADLAVTNRDSLSVSILLGTATGGFGTATHFNTLSGPGRIPTSVAIRDLNGDTFPDLVVGAGGFGLNTGGVQVLLGTGTGSFGTATIFPTSAPDPWAVVIGNFTGDSQMDIAAASRFGSVSVLAGNGTGSFGAPINFDVGDFPTSIAAGDLNADGFPDLVTANADTNNLSFLIANGTGSFNAATSIPIGNYGFGLAIGDLNADGSPDIAVSDNIDANVRVLLNNGAGVFAALPAVSTGAGATSVAIGDLNNDTFVDLAVANFSGGTVSVLSGNGTGAFVLTDNFASPKPGFVAIGKFGTDTASDMVYADEDTNNVSVRLSNSSDPPPSLFKNGFEGTL